MMSEQKPPYAFLFSGQGSQKVGMGTDLAANSPQAEAIYKRAEDILGRSLLDLTDEDLQQTRWVQPAIFVLSYALWKSIPENLRQNAPLAGFSLGEYTALAAGDYLSFDQSLRLIAERAVLMQEASDETPGAMTAVLGLDDAVIEAVLSEHEWKDKVFPVNYNSPGQLVIAGESEAVNAVSAVFREKGASRVIPLAVSGAFHSRFMNTAAEKLEAWAREQNSERDASPEADRCHPLIISNGSGKPLTDAERSDLPAYFAKHMISPVRWTQTIRYLDDIGCTSFIELGPGRTLCGLVRKTVPHQKTMAEVIIKRSAPLSII